MEGEDVRAEGSGIGGSGGGGHFVVGWWWVRGVEG